MRLSFTSWSAPPTAHVIDKQGSEINPLILYVAHELIETVPAGNVKATSSVVRVHLHDLHVVVSRILPDDIQLLLRRILLMFSRYMNILSRAGRGGGIRWSDLHVSPIQLRS